MGVVIVIVMMLVMGGSRYEFTRTAIQHDCADPDDGQAGDHAEHFSHFLGHDVARQKERDEAQEEDTDRVRERGDEAEEHGVLRGTPRADQISGHHRLAVTRLECMQGTQPQGYREAKETDTERYIAAAEHGGEVVAALQVAHGFGLGGDERRCGHRLGLGLGLCRRAGLRCRLRFRWNRWNRGRRADYGSAGDVEGGTEILGLRHGRVSRISGEGLAAVRTGSDHDFFPARALRIVAIFVLQLAAADDRELHFDAHDLHTADTIGEGHMRTRHVGLSFDAADGDVQVADPRVSLLAGTTFKIGRRAGGLQIPFLKKLEGGNFGQVEHVGDVRAAISREDSGIMVDAEIAHGVGAEKACVDSCDKSNTGALHHINPYELYDGLDGQFRHCAIDRPYTAETGGDGG